MIAHTRPRGLTSALALAVVLMLAGEGRAVAAPTAGLTATDAARGAADQRADAARAASLQAAARRRAEALARRGGSSPTTTSTTTTAPRTTTTTTTSAPTTTLPKPVDKTAPGVPSSVKASAHSCSEVTLSWNASTDSGGSGLSGYDVYRDGNFLTQVAAPFVGLVDGSRAASTPYSYQVAAYDKAGNRSARSGAVSARTPSCTGTALLQRLGSLSSLGKPQNLAIDAARGLAVVPTLDRGMRVVQLDTARGPSLASTLGAETGILGVATQGGFAYAIELAYLAGTPVSNLKIFDLRQPSSPALLSQLRLPGNYSGSGVAVEGSMLYAAATYAGLQILDVSNPAAPRIVGSMPTNQQTRDVALGDGVAFVDLGVEFAMVDVRAPTRPMLLRRLGWDQQWVAWHQDTLYRWSNLKLRIWDVASPASPWLITDFAADRSVTDIAFIGNRAFLAVQGGVGVLNVANPAAPVKLATEPSPAPIVEVEASDSGLLVAVDQNGTLTLYSAAP